MTRQILANGVMSQVAQQSSKRTRIEFHLISGQPMVAPVPIDTVADGGPMLMVGFGHICFDIEQHGDMVRQAWRASGFAAVATMIVVEVFLEDT